MATLRTISENIAYLLGDQFNETLRESLKQSILQYRALFTRQDLERNPLSYTDYLQTYCINLIKVDKSQCPKLALGEYVLRSENKVAKPLRIKGNGRINFFFVGSVTRDVSFTFATSAELNYLHYLDFQDEVIYYTYINDYLYVLNNTKLCKILLEYVVADPTSIEDCENPEIFPDDIEFPVPEDMIVNINKYILRDYRQPLGDGEEVNIEQDA